MIKVFQLFLLFIQLFGGRAVDLHAHIETLGFLYEPFKVSSASCCAVP